MQVLKDLLGRRVFAFAIGGSRVGVYSPVALCHAFSTLVFAHAPSGHSFSCWPLACELELHLKTKKKKKLHEPESKPLVRRLWKVLTIGLVGGIWLRLAVPVRERPDLAQSL